MDRHQRNSTVLTHSFPTRRASDLARPRDREARRLRLDRADRQIARARGRGGEIVALDAIDRQVPRSGDRGAAEGGHRRSDEHTSELQSLMRISYAVFCLKKKKPCK